MATHEEIHKRVSDALAQIRPYLLEDGGDVKFIELTTDCVVKIELTGNCTHCIMNNTTFKHGIIDFIKSTIPEVSSVEAMNFELIKPNMTNIKGGE